MCDRDGVCANPQCPCNEPEPCEECAIKDALIVDLNATLALLMAECVAARKALPLPEPNDYWTEYHAAVEAVDEAGVLR